MVVHHVEMDQVGAARNHVANFVAESREVRGKDAGSNSVHGGKRLLGESGL